MLNEALLLLLAAVLVVPIFQRLGLGSVLGYLIAGIVIGPSGFGLFDRVDEVRHFADLGVVFLLFVIGLELKPERLWMMRRAVFGLGMTQVLVSGVLFSFIAIAMGLPTRDSIVIGFGLALSSTAFVLQMLAERHELGAPAGRASFGILLLQDLAIVPLLAMVAVFAPRAGTLSGNLGLSVLEGFGALALVILAGRFAVRPILRHIAAAGNSEVFAGTAILLALGTGWVTEHVGLSMALGAFLAGILLSDSEFRHQITADVEHFRGLLLGLFFMAVGMSIDLALFTERPLHVLALVAGILMTKIIVIYPLARLFGLDRSQAIRAAFYLSQVGEFGFVLFGQAVSVGLLEASLFNLLILATAITMLITPLMFSAGSRLAMRFQVPEGLRAEDAHPVEGAVLVAGFGRFGHRVGKVLEASAIPFVAIDNSPVRVVKARNEGLPVYYGDATRTPVLHHLEAEKASLVVVTLDQTPAAEKAVQAVRRQCPGVPIFARSRSSEDSLVLQSHGVETTIPEALESSLQLAAAVLRRVGIGEEQVSQLMATFREQDYRLFREPGPHAESPSTKRNYSD